MFNFTKPDMIKMIVATEQDANNLKRVADFNRYTYDAKKAQDYYEFDLGIK